MRRLRGFCIALVTCCAAATPAPAQDASKYPEQMVRLIVPFSAGSMTDLLARTVAEKLSERWKQQVIVENRPGLAGTSSVAKAAGDGYTLMLTSNGHTVIGSLNKNLSFDPIKDFVGVSQVAVTPLILVAPPESDTKTLKELVEYRIARNTCSRPLRVELRLRVLVHAFGCSKALRHCGSIRTSCLAVSPREETGARASRLIDDIYGVAALEEVIGPAFTAVGRSHEIRAGLAASVPHHDRIRLRTALRDLVLHIHLARHDLAVTRLRVVPANEEIALLCNRQHSRLLLSQSGCVRTRGQRDARNDKQHRYSQLVHRRHDVDGFHRAVSISF
jgi:hypothetical protein